MTMTRLTTTLAVCAVLSSAIPSCRAEEPAPAGSWDARLTDCKGDVQVYTAGQDKSLPAQKGLPLEEGDRLVTGAESAADVSLDGGSLLHISALSDFTLADLDKKKSTFKLSLGT